MRTANFRRDDGKFGYEYEDSMTGASETQETAKVAEKQRTGRDARFKKGAPKPENSGRRKGTPNKWSQIAAEIMERKGVNPIEEMCDEVLALKGKTSFGERSLRSKLLESLASFAYPKKREVSGEIGFSMEDISARLVAGRARLQKLEALAPAGKPELADHRGDVK